MIESFVSHSDVFLAYLPLAHILELAVELTLLYFGVAIGFGNKRTLTGAAASAPLSSSPFFPLRGFIFLRVPSSPRLFPYNLIRR